MEVAGIRPGIGQVTTQSHSNDFSQTPALHFQPFCRFGFPNELRIESPSMRVFERDDRC